MGATGPSGGGGGQAGAIEAGKAVVRLGVDQSGMRAGLEGAAKMLKGFSQKVSGEFVRGGTALGAVGAVVAGPLGAALGEAVDRFTEVRKASEKLGTTPETFSALGFAAAKTGVDTDGLVAASRRYMSVISEAAAGNGAAAESLARLGLNAKDLADLPLDEKFAALADGIAGVGNEADRIDLTRRILGRGGQDLLPMLQKGSAGLAQMREQAGRLGAIVSKEDAENAKRFTAAIGQAKLAVKYFVESVGAAILPRTDSLKQMSDAFLLVVQQARGFVADNADLIRIVFLIATGVTTAGAALVSLGLGLAGVAAAGAGFLTFGAFVLTVMEGLLAAAPVVIAVGALAAAVAALGYGLYRFTAVGGIVRQLFQKIAGEAMWAWGVISQAWEGIQASFATGDLKGALAIAGAALDVFWKYIQVGATRAWNGVKDLVVDAWHDVVGEAKKAWVDVETEMKIFGTDMEGYLQEKFEKSWENFKNGWKLAWKAVLDMAKAEIEAESKAREYARTHWKEIATSALGVSGLTLAIGGGSKAIDAAADKVAEGQVLADQEGVKTAQEILRQKQKELKDAIDAETARRKQAGHEARQADLDEKVEALKKAEAELQKKVDEAKEKARPAPIEKGPMPREVKIADAVAAITEIRGGFGTGNIQARFGAGSVGDKQLKKLEDIDDKLGKWLPQAGGVGVD
jgi:hypothetical protein